MLNGLGYTGEDINMLATKAAMTTENITLPTPKGYSDGTTFEDQMKVEFVINDRAEAFVFHNKPFKKRLSWIEYDLDTSKLDFVMDNGDVRNFGVQVRRDLSKYLQNAFQILLVLTDEKTNEPVEGEYFPLIIHRA